MTGCKVPSLKSVSVWELCSLAVTDISSLTSESKEREKTKKKPQKTVPLFTCSLEKETNIKKEKTLGFCFALFWRGEENGITSARWLDLGSRGAH